MALLPASSLTRVRDNARRFASGFTSGQKVVVVLVSVGIVGALAIFTSVSGRPSYSILFTNLQPQDAASITQKLATDHVPYQLQNGGTTILVPQNDVDQERLSAAAAGLPAQGNVGLSILDKEGLTTSQLTQQADYLQGLQGELEQTINSIQGVTNSQVSIAMPANQTFALGSNNPTGASVLVDLEPSHSLTYTQVGAITNLVSSAVPGLTTNEVTLADSNGNLLAGPGINDTGALQNGAEQNYDSSEESRLQAYLTGILGSGNADVSVNAQLDFNQVKTSTQTLVPGSNGKQSSFCTNTQSSSTKYAGSGAPSGVTVTTVSGNGNYTQSSKTQTCETGTQTQTVVQAPGAVKGQDVAVLVNSKALPTGLTMAQLQREVAAAAGIQPARGDLLSFSSAVFKPTAAALPAKRTNILTTMVKPALSVLLLLVFLVMLLLASRRARRRPMVMNELPALPQDWMHPTELSLDEEKVTTQELPIIRVRENDSAIAELVNRSPEEVAIVLREMLSPR